MYGKTTPATPKAATSQGIPEAEMAKLEAAAAVAARIAERTRIAAIVLAPEAADHADLALALAVDSDMAPDAAIKLLAAVEAYSAQALAAAAIATARRVEGGCVED